MKNISQCYWEVLYEGRVSMDEDMAYEYNKTIKELEELEELENEDY